MATKMVLNDPEEKRTRNNYQLQHRIPQCRKWINSISIPRTNHLKKEERKDSEARDDHIYRSQDRKRIISKTIIHQD